MAPHGQFEAAPQRHSIYCRHNRFVHPSDIIQQDGAVSCGLGSGFFVPKGLGKPADISACGKGPGPVSGQHKTFYRRIITIFLKYSHDLIHDFVTEGVHGLRSSNRDDFYAIHPVDKKMSMELLVFCDG